MNKILVFFGKIFKTNNYVIYKMMNTGELDYKIKILPEKSNNILDSKIFGKPYNPEGEFIPKNSKQEDLQLLLQINLEDLEENTKLPKSGLLQFFIHSDYIYGITDKEFNNLSVRYVEKQDINNYKNIDYKVFYDKEYKEYGDIDGYKIGINIEPAFLSPNCQELTNIINIHPYNERYIKKITEIMNKRDAEILYNQATKNRLFGFPFFLHNEIREDELFGFPYYDQTRNKTNIHKGFINLLTFNLNETTQIKSYAGKNMILNILIHQEDLQKLNFNNILHKLDFD